MTKAAFFDRDGTINVNFGHVYKLNELEFIPGVPEIIKKHNDEGIPVIVVTNQAGIAKGLYTEEEMHRFNNHLNECLKIEYDAHIDAFYFCPHHPEYTGECECRKPKAGMFFKAAKDFKIDLEQSVMYGDKETDRIAAMTAGIGKFIYVK